MKGTSTRGGKRPGAGRKPLPKEEKRGNLTIKVKPENHESLAMLAEAKGISIGALIEEMVESKMQGWGRLKRLREEKVTNVRFRFVGGGEVFTYLRSEWREATEKVCDLQGNEFYEQTRQLCPVVKNEEGEERVLSTRLWTTEPIEVIWK